MSILHVLGPEGVAVGRFEDVEAGPLTVTSFQAILPY